MNKRSILVVGAIALIALLVVANAAVFAYRWLAGNVTVVGAEQAQGAACTGFYSSQAQPGIGLPAAGGNYNAPTYGNNVITVNPGDAVCTWTVGNKTYTLYESISVTLPLTVGSWYIRDFYGFGYRGGAGDPVVYVTLVVEDALTEVQVSKAELRVYKGGTPVATLDLTNLGHRTTILTLNPGEAFQLDLFIDAQGTGQGIFKVGFYVSQSNEMPR